MHVKRNKNHDSRAHEVCVCVCMCVCFSNRTIKRRIHTKQFSIELRTKEEPKTISQSIQMETVNWIHGRVQERRTYSM